MRRFRFTIAGLAAAVAFLAIAVAALPEATPLWDSLTFTLTLGLLVVSILRVVHLSRERAPSGSVVSSPARSIPERVCCRRWTRDS